MAPATQVRSVGTGGVVALERLEAEAATDDSSSTDGGASGGCEGGGRGRHSRVCSRGSDWAPVPSLKEDLEEAGAKITRAASEGGAYEVVASAGGDKRAAGGGGQG